MKMTTTIKDFCIANNIEWFPIYLELVEGKEGKMEKKLSMINHPAYSGLPKQTDFGTLSKYSVYSHVKHIAMDTRNIYHIDIDVPDYEEVFDEIAELTPYLLPSHMGNISLLRVILLFPHLSDTNSNVRVSSCYVGNGLMPQSTARCFMTMPLFLG